MTTNECFNHASKMAGHYEDMITCCEDKTDLPHLENMFKKWSADREIYLNKLIKKINK